ncbi:hypothetical protein JF535_11340 [Microbulbifer salipaludis]|uniref:Uncharacterized protein n=1 Tax=Microbulbifer salipaludis TaxID=187980 RepID=A0ABS3E816_9GAMM|nr:hypothetical protein [Microbulbifer salipaludis]MBN8431446.1 hypothetical protein [Microbulbifer salipaludis]
MKPLKVKPELASLLKSGQFETFSVPRIRDAYQSLTGTGDKPKKVVSQLVKRHLRKLEECGVLRRRNTDRLHPIEYQLVDVSRLHRSGTVDLELSAVAEVGSEPFPAEVIQGLKAKLNKYRTEMLSAMGALEEYEAIVQASPYLKNTIQSKYDQTREDYAKTLGKVKALESLIVLTPNA